jgi:HPr kinase/phosphorylase
LVGDSGIGKSEAALELISKGYRLIADDAVVVEIKGDKGLFVSPSVVTADLLEIRGLGIINVREVFGSEALREKAVLSLIVGLTQSDESSAKERTDIALDSENLAGTEVPKFTICVKTAKNIPILVETAVRIVKMAPKSVSQAD